MDGYDVAKWERCKELAEDCSVKINYSLGFELTDRRGHNLGVLDSVVEVFAFLCGYEHSVRPVASTARQTKRDKS